MRIQTLADDLTDSMGMTWWLRKAHAYGIDPTVILSIANAAEDSLREWGRLVPEDGALYLRRETSRGEPPQ